MGLTVSHGCWNESCGAFNAWRHNLARAARICLPLMQHWFEPGKYGVYELQEKGWLPIQWDPKDPLTELLTHSDCEGKISWRRCRQLSNRLFKLVTNNPQFGPLFVERTKRFAVGLEFAYSCREDIIFRG